MDIITRKEAIARGLPRYFTGKPCPHGHVAERTTSSGQCCECSRAGCRKWKLENKQKVSAYNKAYSEADPDYQKSRRAEYYAANKERDNAKTYAWREKNRDRYREHCKKAHRKDPDRGTRWCRNNRERQRASATAWLKANPDKHRAQSAKRRASKLKATPSWLTRAQLEEIADFYEQALLADNLTGVKHHVDHIEPLQGEDRCGLHVPWNLQVLTATENISKKNRPVRHFHWKKV